ncbi:MAG: sodium/sugar symporter [Proteobacteria bacterium]|nr:sodium/sugar symporter [Pseudomonadota bacterium]
MLAPVDIAVLAAYGLAIFALAQWVSRERSGHRKDSSDYFLAGKTLPWWAIGASLIAANISAEQIIGMSGSGYVIGLAIASYEWMAALTLVIVGKYFLPIFLENGIHTMPQFLQLRYGARICKLMAVFWLGVYVFVNLTSILWLGSLAVHAVAGIDQTTALLALGAFALVYQLYGGLKAVALTDIVQVALLVAGGLAIDAITLNRISDGHGIVAGFTTLLQRAPEHFHMILSRDNPHYMDLPGLSVLIGGLWVMNLSYWGFNQYIIQRALAAKSLRDAQRGVTFAAYLKLLMPVIVVLPGLAAVLLAPGLAKPDQAYPAMMGLLPSGFLGLVFAALIAAIVASLASKINSVSTIFTLDLYAGWKPAASQAQLVRVGRIVATIAVVLAALTAKPLLGHFDQAFQYIQEFTGFFTPGICVIFLLGLFWKRASEAGALTAAIGSALLSLLFKLWWPALPFMDRVGLVFLLALAGAIIVSLLRPAPQDGNRIDVRNIDYRTSRGFNIAALGIVLVLSALYVTWW